MYYNNTISIAMALIIERG